MKYLTTQQLFNLSNNKLAQEQLKVNITKLMKLVAIKLREIYGNVE